MIMHVSFTSVNDSIVIMQLEDQWASGLVKRDIALFNQILAEGFIYTENDVMFVRDSVLKYVSYGTDTVESAHNEDMQVHMFGKTAAVTGWLITTGRGETGKFNRKYRFTDTWLFIEGRWQIIAAHDYIAP
jgi:ketosteroid isomerase-like protein